MATWRERKGSTPAWRNTRRYFAAALATTGQVPCPFCGEPVIFGEKFDLDHRIPLALGGTDRLDNLRVAHPHCNRAAAANITRERPKYPPRSRTW